MFLFYYHLAHARQTVNITIITSLRSTFYISRAFFYRCAPQTLSNTLSYTILSDTVFFSWFTHLFCRQICSCFISPFRNNQIGSWWNPFIVPQKCLPFFCLLIWSAVTAIDPVKIPFQVRELLLFSVSDGAFYPRTGFYCKTIFHGWRITWLIKFGTKQTKEKSFPEKKRNE